ncbi:MAG: class I SAM-dependent methyltransferase [Candidatus Micrarchaeia archaeon]
MFKDAGKEAAIVVPRPLSSSLFFELKQEKLAFQQLMKVMEGIYGKCPAEHKLPQHCYVNHHISAVLRKIRIPESDISGIRGLKVLDLACGSANTVEKPRNRDEKNAFEPWLSRFFTLAGAAKVVGVDLERQADYERFESHARNLAEKGALGFLADSSFNLVVCCGLVSFTGDAGRDAAAWVGENMTVPEMFQMRSELFSQAQRVLEEGGLFVCDCSPDINHLSPYGLFKKSEGKLERIC